VAAGRDEEVRRLDLATNDALGVRCFKRVGDLYIQFEQLIRRSAS
jgi:hypothetical protein